MKHWAVILALVLAALAGCRTETLSEEFIEDRTPRMEIKGYTTFLYDPLKCQIGFNQDKCEFRVHTDNMSDFFIVRLSEMPSSENQILDGTAQWTTGDDLHKKKTSFSVLKMDGDRIWLWSAESSIAVVVQIL